MHASDKNRPRAGFLLSGPCRFLRYPLQSTRFMRTV